MNERQASWALAGGVAALALTARWPWLAYGVTADEAANLSSQSYAAMWADPETGVNPPLLRALVNTLPELWRIPGGRALSLSCGVAAAALVAAVARRTSGVWAGLVAGGLVALHPIAAQSSAEVRAYAPFMAVAAASLFAEDRGHRRLATATALLLPWLHYLGIVWLVAAGAAAAVDRPTTPGRRLRDRAIAAQPALIGLLGALPLLWPILTLPGRHTPPARAPVDTWVHLAGLGLPPPPLWTAMSASLGSAVMALSVVALLLRALGGPQRRPAVVALALIAAGALISFGQNVRDPVIGLVVVAAAPAISATRSPVMAGVLALWFGASEAALTPALRTRRAATDSPTWLAAQIEALPMGAPLWVHPASAVPLAWVAQTGRPFDVATREGCEGTCFVHDGHRVSGLVRVGDGAGVHGRLVSVETQLPPDFAAKCAVEATERWRVWVCP